MSGGGDDEGRSRRAATSIGADFARAPASDVYADAALADYAKHIRRNRDRLTSLFPGGLFGDPAHDMLLELFIAHNDAVRLTVSVVATTNDVSHTTGLRYLRKLESLDLIRRRGDDSDRRREWVELTEAAYEKMARWLQGHRAYAPRQASH